MNKKIILLAISSTLALSACSSGLDDFNVAGPVAPPLKGVAKTFVPDINIKQDFLLASGTNTVYFDTNESDLTLQARDTLKRQLAWLVTNRDVPITLEGNADSRASDDYNFQLAERRAESVKEYFINGGINEDRITIDSLGETSPVIDKFGDVQINRRVVTIVGPQE